MNILFACNDEYVMPMTVCISSIFENNKNKKINIFVFHEHLSEEKKTILIDMAQKYNQQIRLIEVDSSYFSNAPTLRWSKEAYYRLLINELLPKDMDKILYLDCDTVTNKSIEDFYEMDLKNMAIAALEERNNYYQSGVILFDLIKCKNILSYDKALKIIDDLGDNLLAVDQDIINIIFKGKIMGLDKKFNNSKITRFNSDTQDINETVIFHYASGKPWNKLYSGSCENMWYKYLKLSPYHKLYYSTYDSPTFKILRIKLFKKSFLFYTLITPFINKFFVFLLPLNWYQRLRTVYRKKIK